ncbi:MAG: sigma-54-dependent Fis family transcriptional regulator [Kofleriaceae bacterium]|nr:sigma-54-dependent Fis family transcriptional regulator [Kofleriaceae bacterium]
MSGSRRRQGTTNAQAAATPALAGLLMVAQRLARSPSRCFFIGGDAGVGKGMLASFIHSESTRADRPYLVADLAAMQPADMDLALFGTQGLLMAADGGTLLLQALTVLPNRLQRKLLRVLQERTFDAADGGTMCTVDVRIIVTSNYDLDGAERAMLREDLRYRITAVQLYVPPLRHRRGDVLVLATHFLLNANQGQLRQVSFAPEAMHALQAYPWPNNVHELRQVIETAVATAVSQGRDVLLAGDLNLPAVSTATFPRSSRPPPSPELAFASGSIPSLALVPEGAGVTPGQLSNEGPSAQASVARPVVESLYGPNHRAPTLQGVSAERLWDELQLNGVIE